MNLEALEAHQPAEHVDGDGTKTIVCPTCEVPFPCAVNTTTAALLIDRRPGLTLPERRVLERLTAFIKDYGYPPTIRELAAGQAHSTVSSTLSNLMRKGYLKRDYGVTRGLHIVGGTA